MVWMVVGHKNGEEGERGGLLDEVDHGLSVRNEERRIDENAAFASNYQC